MARRHFGTAFLGTVLDIRVVDNEHTSAERGTWYGGGHRVVLVRVEEDFSGELKAGNLVEVTTGMGGGDCGFPFREQERYVIDASASDGQLSTGTCSQTVSEAAGGLVLQDLRRASTARPADVSGIVLRYSTNSVSGPMPLPVAGIPVILTGLDGQTYRAITGNDGLYQVRYLPLGVYAVHFLVPQGLVSKVEGDTLSVAVPFTNGMGGAGCEVSIAVSSSGKLTGKVLDRQGRGVAGWLTVSDSAPFLPQTGSASAWTMVGADGTFRVEALDAGTYWLTFLPQGQGTTRWFYPGVPAAVEASSVEVMDGQATEGITLVVDR